MTATVTDLMPRLHLAERIEQAEAEVAYLEEMYGGLRDGSITWQQVWPELTCASPQQAAEDEYAGRLDAARRELEAVRPEAAESERAVDENDVPEIAPEVQPEEPAAQREHPEPQARTQAGDDEVIVTWAAKLDEITTVEDAVPISSELERQHKGGVIDSSRYKVISNALKAKVNSLGASNGHQEQPARPARARGPSAEERGAVAVPTGNGDDGPWVKHFEERLGAARRPDDLDGLQAQIGNAVRARKITPAKSADLSKALRDRRNELEGVAA